MSSLSPLCPTLLLRIGLASTLICGCRGPQLADPTPLEPETATPSLEPTPDPPVSSVAVPTRIVVLNDTAAPITFDRSYGPAHSLSVVSLDPGGVRSFVVDDEDDALTGSWIATCVCDCSEGRTCPDCEPPPYETVTLKPGESSVIPWNGQLRRGSDRGCVERLAPEPGSYALTLCLPGGPCARTEHFLPSAEPMELRLSQISRVETCAELGASVGPRLARRLTWVLSRMLPERPVDQCAREPRCVDVHTLEREVAANSAACGVWITPMGETVELTVHLPLPPGTNGGERFVQRYDPDGTRMLEAFYEQ